MAKGLVIELNSAGVQELLKSPEIISVLEAKAREMTKMTGVQYVADTHVGARRANARGVQQATTSRRKK